MNVVAVIPARGGSKGFPRKNLALLRGEPLIAHTIRAALSAQLVDRTIVSTDDDEIAAAARSCGAEVPFRRPVSLATDEASTEGAVAHALGEVARLGSTFDVVAVLQATSPLRTARHVDDAIALLEGTGSDSVVSVCEVEHPPEWIYRLGSDGRMIPVAASSARRRQDVAAAYRLNGAIYLRRTASFLRDLRLVTSETRAYVMARDESVDIDSRSDLDWCEQILARSAR